MVMTCVSGTVVSGLVETNVEGGFKASSTRSANSIKIMIRYTHGNSIGTPDRHPMELKQN